MEPIHLLVPGPTTETITGLKEQHIETTFFKVSGCGNPSKAATNHNYINRAIHTEKIKSAEKMMRSWFPYRKPG
jgi:hypothetical protein